jgi:lysozyme family protein
MQNNFDDSFARLIQSEGGYVFDKNDAGGETNLGVTKAAWASYLGRAIQDGEMKALTVDVVKPFYKKMYWDKMHCDDLPKGLDYAAFDFAVNAGVGQSSKFIQRSVGAKDDGSIGPATLAAVAKADPRMLLLGFTNQKVLFYRGLVEKNATQEKFLKGWLARATEVENKAMTMLA